MQNHITLTIIIGISILIIGGCVAFANQSAWKIYTNSNRAFSFSYPKSWGEPRVLENQKSNEFQVDFGNYEFSVNNGYYFGDINGKRPTVSQLMQGYKDDMDSKNEVKYFQTENIEVDSRRAIKVSIDNLNGTHFTDVYIYDNPQNEADFILVTANKGFVDDATFNKILSTFKFAK